MKDVTIITHAKCKNFFHIQIFTFIEINNEEKV